MPRFSSNDDIVIDVDDFISECNEIEIEEVIQNLRDSGYIKEKDLFPEPLSIIETIFEENLNKLHGKFHSITSEEEELIMKIASRFI